MGKIEISHMSTSGQLVIPYAIRKRLNLKHGDKFITVAKDGAIILKKIPLPTLKQINPLLKEIKNFEKASKSKKAKQLKLNL